MEEAVGHKNEWETEMGAMEISEKIYNNQAFVPKCLGSAMDSQ